MGAGAELEHWWRDKDLDGLRFHWGEAYLIDYLHQKDGGVRWVAQRRDSHATVSAETPDALLLAIREDYDREPVPRSPLRQRTIT